MQTTLHSAPIVLPVTAAPIGDGAVLVEGDRIRAVGGREELAAAHPGVPERRWPGVLTPGLVNAHAHLQYTDFEELNTLGQPFPIWIAELTARRDGFTDAMWSASAQRGVTLMLAAGTTAVADVVTEACVLAPTAESGIGGISYLEVVFQDARSWSEYGRNKLLDQLGSAPAGRILGVSPHTPQTVASAVYVDAVAIARDKGLRIHPHLAESKEETEYVALGTGPHAAAMLKYGKAMELIRDGGSGLTPTLYLDKLGVLAPDVHAAHCIHCDPADRAKLRERGVIPALCARSNELLQAGQPPVADYLREQAVFAIGTDSLASSPSLDLLEEAAALRDLARDQGYADDDLDRRILHAATLGGAAAMALPDLGHLAPGARADLAAFTLPGLATLPPAAAPSALLDAAATGTHRCVATVLGGVVIEHAG